MGFLGIGELLLILGVVIALFGARRLPDLGRSLGRAVHGFRKEATGRDDGQLERVVRERPVPPRPPEEPPAPAPPIERDVPSP